MFSVLHDQVIANAIRRNQEDAAGVGGPLDGTRPTSEVEKGVRVSSFATTLGIPPFLFMREVGNVVAIGVGACFSWYNGGEEFISVAWR